MDLARVSAALQDAETSCSDSVSATPTRPRQCRNREAAGTGRHSRPGAAHQGLSLPALRRHAAPGDDRHGAELQPRAGFGATPQQPAQRGAARHRRVAAQLGAAPSRLLVLAALLVRHGPVPPGGATTGAGQRRPLSELLLRCDQAGEGRRPSASKGPGQVYYPLPPGCCVTPWATSRRLSRSIARFNTQVRNCGATAVLVRRSSP